MAKVAKTLLNSGNVCKVNKQPIKYGLEVTPEQLTPEHLNENWDAFVALLTPQFKAAARKMIPLDQNSFQSQLIGNNALAHGMVKASRKPGGIKIPGSTDVERLEAAKQFLSEQMGARWEPRNWEKEPITLAEVLNIEVEEEEEEETEE